MSSGVVLYLAIVVMWLCVLVPMWLHRDRNTLAESHKDVEPYAYDERVIDEDSAETLTEPLPVSSADAPAPPSSGFPGEPGGPGGRGESWEASPDAQVASGTGSEAQPPARPPAAKPVTGRAVSERRRAELRRRGKQVAKRRRLTLWCVLLLLASVVTAVVQVIPWWGVAPSVVLLGVYMAVLRVTVQIDAERRAAIARAHAERAKRARRRAALLEAQRPVAEIIDLTALRDEIFDQYAETPRRAVGD
ncbi:hypothetical protein [Streptosporangium sp. NPDC002721]|uniref:divisome protein SepX/GlpR n=1 Tax=Streptosporangium sp. NPDC002721 TaxID=3366188 RepID=UPI003678222C